MSTDLLQLAAIPIGVVTSLAAAVAVVVAYINKSRIELLRADNAELRATIEFVRHEHEIEKQNAIKETADLRAQVDFLRGEVVHKLVESLQEALVSAARAMAESVDRRDSVRTVTTTHTEPEGV